MGNHEMYGAAEGFRSTRPLASGGGAFPLRRIALCVPSVHEHLHSPKNAVNVELRGLARQSLSLFVVLASDDEKPRPNR